MPFLTGPKLARELEAVLLPAAECRATAVSGLLLHHNEYLASFGIKEGPRPEKSSGITLTGLGFALVLYVTIYI